MSLDNKYITHPFTFNDEEYIIYNSNYSASCKGDYICHLNKCPHQGASFTKGFVNCRGNIVCPYHHFEFDNGTFVGIHEEQEKLLASSQKKVKINFRLLTFNRLTSEWKIEII